MLFASSVVGAGIGIAGIERDRLGGDPLGGRAAPVPVDGDEVELVTRVRRQTLDDPLGGVGRGRVDGQNFDDGIDVIQPLVFEDVSNDRIRPLGPVENYRVGRPIVHLGKDGEGKKEEEKRN